MIYEPGSPEWLAERRGPDGDWYITSTDVPAILGVSPWASEGDVARSKLDGEQPEVDAETARRFRLGHAMEEIIAREDEIEHGYPLVTMGEIFVHPEIAWARTSLDYARHDRSTIVEIKTSARRDFDDGLPEDIEAQVRWQMGVTGIPAAHIAALRFGSRLECFDLVHDEPTWLGLVMIARDFRERLRVGGPFAESKDSVRRKWRDDDGSTIAPDAELDEAVRSLIDVRARIKSQEELRDALETAVQDRMGPASVLEGSGYRVTWKRAKDSEVTDWKLTAIDALALIKPEDADVIRSLHTATKPGSRRFLVRVQTEQEDVT